MIAIGTRYLRIVGFPHHPCCACHLYIATLRSIQFVKITVIATTTALIFKTILGYMLIFGYGIIYTQKTPLAANPLTFFSFDMSFFTRVLKTTLPALANEMFWSLGITTYNAIYAHIGTDAIAAINVNATIEEFGVCRFHGLGNACAVMVGNRIGAGKRMKPMETVRRIIILGVSAAWVVGIVVVLMRDVVTNLHDLSPSGVHNVRMLMLMMACTLWIRMFISTFIGALRAGGDTRFALIGHLFHLVDWRACGVCHAVCAAFPRLLRCVPHGGIGRTCQSLRQPGASGHESGFTTGKCPAKKRVDWVIAYQARRSRKIIFAIL
ncbi:MATE family efflux transporter [Candidatus Villigracilis affinis]|uniref:MATE family efflux transporter n=1 Tax=Candidatus Villigracilis affinis TaxID=3140682 RepID=UPI002A1AFD58|nr:hypothetical protein [Anaerolineales bacterium]